MAQPNRRGAVRRALAALSLVGGLAFSAGITSSCGVVGSGENGPDAKVVELFKVEGALWIRAERERYRPRAVPLSDEDRRAMAAYFPHQVLDKARVLVVEGFENPDFFSVFEDRGEPYPVDLRQASALALVDTILVARRASASAFRDRLLFHELVHLVQYEVLGLERYMEGYVDSWAENGRRYRGIPHEQQAFELATRFSRSGADTFSVETEVRSRFEAASGSAPNR